MRAERNKNDAERFRQLAIVSANCNDEEMAGHFTEKARRLELKKESRNPAPSNPLKVRHETSVRR